MEDLLLWLCIITMVGLSFIISLLGNSSSRLFHINEKLTELEAELSRKETNGGSE